MNSRCLLLAAYVMACSWPFAQFLQANFDELARSSFQPVWQLGLICLLVGLPGLAAWLVLRRVLRGGDDRLLPVILAGVLLFYAFRPAFDTVIAVIEWLDVDRGGFVAYVLFALGVLVVCWKLARYPVFRQSLAVGVLVMSAIPLVLLLPPLAAAALATLDGDDGTEAADTAAASTGGGGGAAAAAAARPDVFYIVVDGFVGDRGFERMFGSSLDGFIESFTARGFTYLEESYSNYVGSASSIGSLFHLGYFRDDVTVEDDVPPSSYFPAITSRRRPAPLLVELQRLGYRLFMSGSWYSGCQEVHFTCVREQRLRFNRETRLVFGRTPLPLLLPALFEQKIDPITPISSEFLAGELAVAAPVFVFAHYVQPHSPWYVDGECRAIDTSLYTDRQLYQFSVDCIRRTLEGLLDRVREQGADPLVVIHGDHGWLMNDQQPSAPEIEWPPAVLDQRAEILALVKAPEGCRQWLRDDLGPVNLMRFTLACIQAQQPDYLPEALYIPGPDYANSGRLVRADDRLSARR